MGGSFLLAPAAVKPGHLVETRFHLIYCRLLSAKRLSNPNGRVLTDQESDVYT